MLTNTAAFEVTVRREGVQFGFDDDIECSNCGADLRLTNSSENPVHPAFCPHCGGKIKWESNKSS